MRSKNKNVHNVLEWRRRAKRRLVDAFGGRCGICGYNRCDRNLVFHHINPDEKEFSFGSFQSKAWHRVVSELRKCVMLCHNCHGEVHAGMADVENCSRFNEQFAEYKEPRPIKTCLWCQQPVHFGKKYCSIKCHGYAQRQTGIKITELLELLKGRSFVSVASELGVSDNGLRKILKRNNIDPSLFGRNYKKDGGSGVDSNPQPLD